MAAPPRALVTGASSFVGSAIVRACLESGRTVRGLVRPRNDNAALEGLGVEVVEGDVRDRAAVRRAVAGVDEVFHAAGLSACGAHRIRDLYDINVSGTSTVLEACRDAGVARIVHTSAAAAVGARDDGIAADETQTFNLGGRVGDHASESKHQAEMLALEHAAAGLPVVVVNPARPIGARDRRPTSAGRVMLALLRGHVPAYPRATISLVDVDDLARAHLLCAERGRTGERYLVAADNVTVKEFLARVASAGGRGAPRLALPDFLVPACAAVEEARARALGIDALATRACARMRRFTLWYDSSKARRELGVTFRPLEDTVGAAIDWFRQEGYVW